MDSFYKHKKLISILLVGSAVGGTGVWLTLKALKPIARSVCQMILEDDEQKIGRLGRVTTVEAQAVKGGPMTKRVISIGKLKANASVKIRSEIDGRIDKISFTEGSSIKKGQPLIQFENSELIGERDRAEAQLILASATYKRLLALRKNQAVSGTEFDKALGEYQKAKAELAIAKARLEKSTIYAPFDGKIGIIDVSPGAVVRRDQDLVQVVDITPIKVDFKVASKHVGDIGVGQTVEIRLDVFKDKVFKGIVEAVEPSAEEESLSIRVKGSLPNEEGVLKPGLFVNVSLIIGERGEVLRVDEACLEREGDIEIVWVVEKGKAQRRRILTGVKENGMVEIVSGLKSGDIVVTAGQIKLSEGARVKITNMQEGEKQDPAAAPEGLPAAAQSNS